MADLRDRLRDIERTPAPNLWNDAVERTPGPMPPDPRRRRYATLAVALAVATAGIAIPLRLVTDGERATSPDPTPSGERSPARFRALVPDTYREGGDEVVPIVFPDGTAAELLYPPELALAALGLQPDVGLVDERNPAPRYEVVFTHRPGWGALPRACRFDGSVGGFNRPLRTASGRSVIAQGDSTGYCLYYVDQRDDWGVLVPGIPRLTPEELVEAVDLRQVDGFPVLEVSGAVRLAEEYGEDRGPQLTIGDMDPDPNGIFADGDRWIDLAPVSDCPESAFCIGDDAVRIMVQVNGDTEFVERVETGLRARGKSGSAGGGYAPFVPSTSREGDLEVLPVIFPDGTSAELMYPAELELAAMGVQPDVAIRPADPDTSPYGYMPTFYFGEPQGTSGPTLRSGSGTPVDVRKGPPREETAGQLVYSSDPQLVYRLPSWSVTVPMPSQTEPADVVRDIDIYEDRGWPRVDAQGRFVLSRESGEGRGPVLTFGDREPSERSILPTNDRWIQIWVEPCTPENDTVDPEGEEGAGAYAHRCLGGAFTAEITSLTIPDEWVREVYEGLQVRNVRAP